MPAAQPERHTETASHERGRARIRFHGKRASEGTLHGDGHAFGEAARETRRSRASVPGTGRAGDALCCATHEVDRGRSRHGGANLILTPTKDTADHIATQQQIPRERVRVLPWALDPDFEALATASQTALPANFPSGRIILTVGRWQADERYKGMDTLISALPRLLHEWPDLQLVAVGGGDDQAWLEQLAEGCGVRRHVHFFSELSYPELAACYSACDIFALPSRGEGFGLVYLEAMARGKPVIGGAHGGAPEVIDDGRTGYLVQHGDAPQLATSIETLLANPELAREMGARGRERVNRDFKFSVFSKSLKKIFRELCES
jgi:phosphatidylinositol alpha-1,6-mannosyltransferase